MDKKIEALPPPPIWAEGSLYDALATLWGALAPFATNVGEGLLWLWENVLVPLGTWTVDNIVPLFIEGVAAALTAFNEIWDAVRPGLEWLWTNFLQPIAEWTGDVIADVLQNTVDVLNDFAEWCADNHDAIQDIATVIGSFAAAWVLVNGAVTLWNAIGAIATGVTGGFGAAVAVLTSPVTLITLAIGALIAIVALLITHWDEVKAAAVSCWDKIKSVFSTVANWFTEHIINPITRGFKSFINSLLSFVEGFVNFFIRGINAIIGAFNKISFTVPDWVPSIGGKSFGFNIPKVSELKLPRLATGAVIPPNREFMAVLGDQTSGNNLEAPESLIRQIVREETSGMNNEVLQAILQVLKAGQVIKVNETVLGKTTAKAINRASAAAGKSLI